MDRLWASRGYRQPTAAAVLHCHFLLVFQTQLPKRLQTMQKYDFVKHQRKDELQEAWVDWLLGVGLMSRLLVRQELGLRDICASLGFGGPANEVQKFFGTD